MEIRRLSLPLHRSLTTPTTGLDWTITSTFYLLKTEDCNIQSNLKQTDAAHIYVWSQKLGPNVKNESPQTAIGDVVLLLSPYCQGRSASHKDSWTQTTLSRRLQIKELEKCGLDLKKKCWVKVLSDELIKPMPYFIVRTRSIWGFKRRSPNFIRLSQTALEVMVWEESLSC